MPATPFVTSDSSHQPAGAVAGSAFVPSEDAEMRGNHAPRLTPRAAFYYFAQPERWQVLEGKVLPLLGKMKLRAGVGGVTAGRVPGSVNLRAAKVDLEEKRRILIPVDSVPPAHRAKSYLSTVDGCPGVVISLYEKAYPGLAETRPDTKRWVEFLEYQVGRTVPAPGEHVLERMLDERVKSRERAMSHEKRNTSKIERLEQEIEVLRAELDKRVEMAEPVDGSAAVPMVEE
jgi:hypothetical protein